MDPKATQAAPARPDLERLREEARRALSSGRFDLADELLEVLAALAAVEVVELHRPKILSRIVSPPPAFRCARSSRHLQRSSLGTLPSTCSTWAPQPAQDGR